MIEKASSCIRIFWKVLRVIGMDYSLNIPEKSSEQLAAARNLTR
jgi:hypothetical protein